MERKKIKQYKYNDAILAIKYEFIGCCLSLFFVSLYILYILFRFTWYKCVCVCVCVYVYAIILWSMLVWDVSLNLNWIGERFSSFARFCSRSCSFSFFLFCYLNLYHSLYLFSRMRKKNFFALLISFSSWFVCQLKIQPKKETEFKWFVIVCYVCVLAGWLTDWLTRVYVNVCVFEFAFCSITQILCPKSVYMWECANFLCAITHSFWLNLVLPASPTTKLSLHSTFTE